MNDKQKRPIGLHVRLQQGLHDVVEAVERMNLQVVQSFLLDERGSYVSCSSSVVKKFLHNKKNIGFEYFVHAAYWSSLTNVKSKEFLSLCKEADIALDLDSAGIVVHVGATKAKLSKKDQLLYVADGVNELLRQIPDISIVLENSPHSGRNFGGDLTDFELLHPMIEQSQRVQYCIDTAHAFVYGYNLFNAYERQIFFDLLVNIFKDKQIALVHLNDAQHACASQIDKHEVPGKGLIGTQALQASMTLPLCQQVPIILELPHSCQENDMVTILDTVQRWDTPPN